MLVTCAEGVHAVASGWQDPYSHFIAAVKNLAARDLSSLGEAMKEAFYLLNMFRYTPPCPQFGRWGW